jgi:hypothetical protein
VVQWQRSNRSNRSIGCLCPRAEEEETVTAPLLDRETILRTIQTWSPAEQLALAQEIVRRATTTPLQAATAQRPSWREMAGLAAVPGQEPPSDEQVAQWLDEHRTEKYGAS